MEILRLPNVTTYVFVVEGLEANTLHTARLTDLFTKEVFVEEYTSEPNGDLEIEIPEQYRDIDGNFLLKVYEGNTVVYIDDVQVVRPYNDPAKLVQQFDIALSDAIKYERLARFVIDSVAGGFYYTVRHESVTGGGLDYLIMDEPIWRLISLSENNELLWDETVEDIVYAASIDNTSVVLQETGEQDRLEHRPIWFERYSLPVFVDGYDYDVVAEFGWPVVPSTIKEASLLLIEDITCGNSRYTNRYIEKYDNSAFKITYNKEAFQGTGNLLVDQLLAPYTDDFVPRIL